MPINLANILTLSRIVLAGVIAWLLLQNILIGHILAAVCFLLAALTDLYDGYLARQMKLVSNFGKIMDPIADKVLMLSLFAVLSMMGMVAWWMVVIIAIREIWVTADRLWAMLHGQVLAAERAGKVKTALQMIGVSIILLYLIADQSAACASWFYQAQKPWLAVINTIMLATVAITVYSGYVYFRSKGKQS